MVITILEATVAPDRVADLKAAYSNAGTKVPPGLVRTDLLSASADPTRWRIQTFWSSRAALDAMRQHGTPAGVLMFRAAGAEPTLSVYDVVASITAEP
jgi:quinol monooxygenase YgiN